MATISIRRKIDSDTLVLPELVPLIGKTVDIQVTVEPELSSDERWAAAAKAIAELEDYDFSAYAEQREFDRLHAEDHLK
ncbi:MAG: hypothetical protein KF873_16925 [Gemmataceae bacterium]|nr:hypothetical protein [Gemmataceae bacterium]